MKRVDIFAEAYPRNPKIGKGEYRTVVQYTKKDGEKVFRIHSGIEENTTFNRISMIAALEGLKILTESCEVHLFSENHFLIGCIKQNTPEKWRSQEWKNSRGKDVANKELWQQFVEEMDRHKITVAYRKN